MACTRQVRGAVHKWGRAISCQPLREACSKCSWWEHCLTVVPLWSADYLGSGLQLMQPLGCSCEMPELLMLGGTLLGRGVLWCRGFTA